MPNSEKMMEMRLLITMELELNGFSVEKDLWLSSMQVLDEITHILIPELHEGKIHPCGALFLDQAKDIKNTKKLPLQESQLKLARKLANGINSFLLYENNFFAGLLFFNEPLVSEVQVIHILTELNALIVQRDASGVAKFFTQNSIHIHDNRVWLVKPHVHEATQRIAMCIPGIDTMVLQRILEFAFHLISPASRTGATLVCYLNCPLDEELRSLHASQELQPLHLSILDDYASEAICHLFSQVDGATILNICGEFISTGVHLHYSANSSQLIAELKGTRHTSALRFSYDYGHTLVIVVSEDGPVAVFSNGAQIANLPMYSSGEIADLLKNVVHQEAQKISSNSLELQCMHCQKTAMIEIVTIPECAEPQTVLCPVCKHPLHSADCFSLEVRSLNKIYQSSLLSSRQVNRKDTPLTGNISSGELTAS